MAFTKREAAQILQVNGIHPPEKEVNRQYKKVASKYFDSPLMGQVNLAYEKLCGHPYVDPDNLKPVQAIPFIQTPATQATQAPQPTQIVPIDSSLALPLNKVAFAASGFILELKEPTNIPALIHIDWLKLLLPEEIAWVQRKCQTDLWFLCDRVLRNPRKAPLVPEVHLGIIETLLHPSPDLPFEEWSPIKERIILAFRGALKSWLAACNIVQILLCDPNIRVLVLSGKLTLAKSIIKMVRGHFRGCDSLAFLFPSYCERKSLEAQNSNEFICPARDESAAGREPTISGSTFDSVKSGMHQEIIILDDASNEINSRTAELIEKTIDCYDDLDPLLEPGGYRTILATRWNRMDLPEVIRQRGQEYFAKTGQINTLYFCEPVWALKVSDSPILQAERESRQREFKLEPSDVDLIEWSKLDLAALFKQYHANPYKFSCQYLLEPTAIEGEVFGLDLLLGQTRPISEAPLPHLSAGIYQNWDMASLSGNGDFFVGISGDWEYPILENQTGRLFLTDCIMDKFYKSSQVIGAILDLYERNGGDDAVVRVRIELAAGAGYLKEDLDAEALLRNLNPQLDWQVPSNQRNAKSERIFALKAAMAKDMVQFWTGMPHREDIFSQFVNFASKNNRTVGKDDAPDCIAQLWESYSTLISPTYVETMAPTGKVLMWETPEDNNSIPSSDELSAAQDAARYTVLRGA